MSLFARSFSALLVLALSVPAQTVTGSATYGGDTTRPAPLPAKPAATVVDADHLPGVLCVKFAHDSGVALVDGVYVRDGQPLADVNEALALRGAEPRRMFLQSDEWLRGWRASGEARSGIALHDLTLFSFVDVPAGASVADTCDALNALDVVRLAWPAVSGGDPVFVCPAPAGGGDPGGTPDFSGLQDYRGPAPDGVDAVYGNTFSGGRGEGVTIIDCETGWTDDHEDLAAVAEDQFVGFFPPPYPWDHGTAVLGEMVGQDNGYGVQGIAHRAGVRMSTHSPQGGVQNIPGSVANGAAAAGPGDFVVIEIQCFGGPPGPYPCEFDPAIFATVQTATANGVHVYAAAGNGNNDLDQPAYGGAFDLNVKDSGAVLVGASDGVLLGKASFSNYGSRLTSSGWGWDVVTTAYGSLQGGLATVEYADDFSGTSSATPIVTGAAVIVSSMHREAFGTSPAPLTLRALLSQTGTPQVGTQQIGSRPDVRSAVEALALPRIELSGGMTPGGFLTVTSRGTAGDAYLLFWSPLRLSDPLHLPPWGYLSLDPVVMVQLPVGGTLGPGGDAADSYFTPNNPALSGIVTWFQGAQAFGSQSGTGSLSNVVPFRFP